MKFGFLILFLILFLPKILISQTYNQEVEAKIYYQSKEGLTKITGSSFNKTAISQSLRYVLSVIKNNPNNSNKSKNDQSGRFVLESGQKTELSSTIINNNTSDRVIVLLLIYDLEDKIIGKDRIVFNDNTDKDDIILKENLSRKLAQKQKDVSASDDDGIVLRGIVLEEVKTKPAQDFYKIFYSDYSLQNINAEKIVKIDEIILMANTTLIRIFVADKMVHRFISKPQNDYLKANSRKAIKEVSKYLVYLNKNKNYTQQY